MEEIDRDARNHGMTRLSVRERPAEITKYQHWLSVAISIIEQLHRTLHHASKFQGVM